MIKKFFVLFLIFSLAAFLRFYQLGHNPPSLTWDEAAWGYNAYSLGIDGKDEFGNFLPVQYLESFGDFKPPVYAYLDILPVKIFGLNEFAVRFPSALFGVLTVLITYFLVKRLFHPQGVPQAQHHLGGVEALALMSSFFLAISPWHINLSRAAFEANVATFFIVLGVFLSLKAVSRGVALYLALSITSFVLSMYTFNTARIVAPLLVISLAIGFRKELFAYAYRKQTFVATIVGVILIIPLLQFLMMPQAKLRFHEVNIFSDIGVIERANAQIANDGDVWWSKILHNRRFAYAVEYARHYLDHFNPGFLFIKGDGNPKFSTQDTGQLYLFDLPFLVIGIVFLLRKKEGFWWIIPLWLLIGIIPAATARETPHALRIETTLPTWQVLVAYGFYQFIERVKGKGFRVKKFILLASCFLLFANFLYYIHGYYTHYQREFSGEWQYGYKEAISFVNDVKEQYDKVVFTEALGRPYIYMLFYTKENPETFRSTAKIYRETYGFVHVNEYGKYIFTKETGNIDLSTKKVLYLDTPARVPDGANVLKIFQLLNGDTALVAYVR